MTRHGHLNCKTQRSIAKFKTDRKLLKNKLHQQKWKRPISDNMKVHVLPAGEPVWSWAKFWKINNFQTQFV